MLWSLARPQHADTIAKGGKSKLGFGETGMAWPRRILVHCASMAAPSEELTLQRFTQNASGSAQPLVPQSVSSDAGPWSVNIVLMGFVRSCFSLGSGSFDPK